MRLAERLLGTAAVITATVAHALHVGLHSLLTSPSQTQEPSGCTV